MLCCRRAPMESAGDKDNPRIAAVPESTRGFDGRLLPSPSHQSFSKLRFTLSPHPCCPPEPHLRFPPVPTETSAEKRCFVSHNLRDSLRSAMNVNGDYSRCPVDSSTFSEKQPSVSRKRGILPPLVRASVPSESRCEGKRPIRKPRGVDFQFAYLAGLRKPEAYSTIRFQ